MNTRFINAVEEKDLANVRFYLSNELALDPRGNSFHEMLIYAENKLEGLYEEDNGIVFEQDQSKWDDIFLSKVKIELEDNFSREKLDFYEIVVKQILKEKARRLDESEANKPKEDGTTTDQQFANWFENHKKEVYTGVTAGGALLTTIGICVSKAALTTFGVVGLAVGGYMLYKETKK